MDFLIRHIEALIFCAQHPITISEIQQCLSEMFDSVISSEDIEKAIETLQKKYENEGYSFQIVHIANGFQFLTKPAYQLSIGILLKQKSKKRLSNSAIETLSIIAYKQPITKSELENIRGVNCDYSIHKLLDKELVTIVGKSDGIGRPLLYGTSPKFMEYFGINSLKDLPSLKEIDNEDNTIGNKKE